MVGNACLFGFQGINCKNEHCVDMIAAIQIGASCLGVQCMPSTKDLLSAATASTAGDAC